MPSFTDVLRDRAAAVDRFLRSELPRVGRKPKDLYRAARVYFERPAKRLRPCLVLLSASACGADEQILLPAAAAVEVFHTWTLIHDDLIDRDEIRRGKPSVHELGRRWALENFAGDETDAKRYGRDLAVLAGDLLEGWAVSLILRCARTGRVPYEVACALAERLACEVTQDMLRGELLDVQLALRAPEDITRAEIIRMMELKTASLVRFSAVLGASLAIGTADRSEPRVAALGAFARKCGLAFQIRDDILGITGDQNKLGKPVGSDLREGKRTIIIASALSRSQGRAKTALRRFLANERPQESDVARMVTILRDCGAIEAAARLARRYVRDALRDLERLPPSESRDALANLARFMTQRAF